jgi:hypothetical protein
MPSPKAGGKYHEERESRLPVPLLRRQDHNAGRERIAISDPMRELIKDLWPKLAHKLPPKAPQD